MDIRVIKTRNIIGILNRLVAERKNYISIIIDRNNIKVSRPFKIGMKFFIETLNHGPSINLIKFLWYLIIIEDDRVNITPYPAFYRVEFTANQWLVSILFKGTIYGANPNDARDSVDPRLDYEYCSKNHTK